MLDSQWGDWGVSMSRWQNIWVLCGVVACILLAVWFSTVVALGPAPGSIKRGTEDHSGQSKQRAPSATAPNHHNKPPTAEQKSTCSEGETNEQCFQRRSLVAAEDQARATEEQALYTLIGLVLLFLTLAATGAAAIAAFRAASAARDTVKTMEDTAKRELRAYVFGKPNRIFCEDGGVTKVDVVVRNHGKTPAKGVALRGSVNICPYPLPANFDRGNIGEGKDPNTLSLGPHTEYGAIIQVNRKPGATDAHDLRMGTQRVFVFAAIKYRNVFDKDCTTNICASIINGNAFMDGLSKPGKGSIPVEWAFDSQHNESD